jgi:hypothetical protein
MTRDRMMPGLLFVFAATASVAQADTSLPLSLKGEWTALGQGENHGRSYVDHFSLAFEGNGAPGSVAGRLTLHGVNCGAKDEPIQASWDGSELKFEAVLRANTNTQSMNGNCPAVPTRWVLRRKAGDPSFEGEGHVGSITVTATAAP